jgi:transcriptional regulator with XRE-family HTH domain
MTNEGWVPDPAGDFGARLALVRYKKGWNRTKAAQSCGVDPTSWTGWELYDRLPRDLAGTSLQIADATGCDYFWLMSGVTRGYHTFTHVLNTHRRPHPVVWCLLSPQDDVELAA